MGLTSKREVEEPEKECGFRGGLFKDGRPWIHCLKNLKMRRGRVTSARILRTEDRHCLPFSRGKGGESGYKQLSAQLWVR